MAMKAAALILLAVSAPFCASAQESPLPRFEVASVKPIDLRARNAIDIKVAPGGRVIITAATLIQLIAGAYGGLQEYQVSGPPWIASESYDVQAEPPENDYGKQPTTLIMGRQVPEIAALRLRALLIERFHLKTHFETKDHTVYDLITAKGGPKMKGADPKGTCSGGRQWRLGHAVVVHRSARLRVEIRGAQSANEDGDRRSRRKAGDELSCRLR